MIELKIKPEFKKLIPPLTTEEFTQLEQNCIAEGIRDAIVIWNGYIIDGHNRYEIAQRYDLEYRVLESELQSEANVIEWMILNQFGRRNLNNYQRSILALQLENVFRIKAKENQGNRNDICQNSDISSIDSKKELAKIADVSHDTIMRVKAIEAKAPEEVKEKLRIGEVSINQAYQEIKKEEKKINFEQKKSEFEKPIKSVNNNQIVLHGDSCLILPTLKENNYDLLLSDPPYGMDFNSGWSDKKKIENDTIDQTASLMHEVLSKSVSLLKDDAHFYLFGSIDYLNIIKPIIETYLNLKNILIWDRKIIGMGDLKTYGKSYDIIYFGYNKKWKELNGTRDRDLLSYNRVDPSKIIHPTEKPIDLLEYLIKKSTKENDNILEPFAGGGSTLIAAKNTNRMATGIEIDVNYVELIKSRI